MYVEWFDRLLIFTYTNPEEEKIGTLFPNPYFFRKERINTKNKYIYCQDQRSSGNIYFINFEKATCWLQLVKKTGAGGLAQLVKHLLYKHKDLNSFPKTHV